MTTYYLEDFKAGQTFRTAGVTFDEAEIIAFAERFDPQSIHIDRDAAAQGPYGGIIASGYHTAAGIFRAFVDLGLIEDSSLGGPGIDEMRWLLPVRPGDTITTEIEVLEARPSKSRPDRGIIRYSFTGRNQRGEIVITVLNASFVKRRDAQSPV